MIVILSCIIGILVIVVLLLSLSIFFLLKKTTFITNKEKEFILFTIDMYINYAKELDIHSKEDHESIVAELNKIKEKHLKK